MTPRPDRNARVTNRNEPAMDAADVALLQHMHRTTPGLSMVQIEAELLRRKLASMTADRDRWQAAAEMWRAEAVRLLKGEKP